ncbi:hypothetical protein [Nonomuraea sp. LPB2021202275-12-8]
MSDEPATDSDLDEVPDQGPEASEGEAEQSTQEGPPPDGFVPL